MAKNYSYKIRQKMNHHDNNEAYINQQQQQQRRIVNIVIFTALTIIVVFVLGSLFFSSSPSSSSSPLPNSLQKEENVVTQNIDNLTPLTKLVADVSAVLRRNGIAHWLVRGSLKKWYEKKMEFGYVAELGVLTNVATVLAKNLPGSLYVVMEEGDFGVQVAHKQTGVTVEFIRYDDSKEKGKLHQQTPNEWMRRMYNDQKQQVIPVDWIFPVRGAQFAGGQIEVPIPNKYQQLIL